MSISPVHVNDVLVYIHDICFLCQKNLIRVNGGSQSLVLSHEMYISKVDFC